MKKFFTELFQDETGSFSSKRFIGIIAGLTLCITLFANSLSSNEIKPADSLVNAVAMLSFGCLGLASVDKIWAKRPNIETTPEKEVEPVVKEE
jgi:zinc transporter ZupT